MRIVTLNKRRLIHEIYSASLPNYFTLHFLPKSQQRLGLGLRTFLTILYHNHWL